MSALNARNVGLLRRETSFYGILCEAFRSFREVFRSFCEFFRLSDVFAPIWIHLDPVGYIRTHSEATGSVWMFSNFFDVFWIWDMQTVHAFTSCGSDKTCQKHRKTCCKSQAKCSSGQSHASPPPKKIKYLIFEHVFRMF